MEQNQGPGTAQGITGKWKAIAGASLAIGIVGMIMAGLAISKNEAYHEEQLASDSANGAKIWATDLNVSAAQGDLASLRGIILASNQNISRLEAPWIGTSISFSCYSPWFSPEEFTVKLGWANFGKSTAHGAKIDLTFHWGTGNTHYEGYWVGDVYGNSLGSETKTYTFETGGCDGLWMETPVVSWTCEKDRKSVV